MVLQNNNVNKKEFRLKNYKIQNTKCKIQNTKCNNKRV